ncbi:phage tail protein domain-containing protein [Lentzea fradiae]|uniref:Phage tail protein domain-containing protein n=1 Tax=Lentzea fradiae TaxID=200378 RepID=A0A1G7L7W8_9PSEU|nr:phage tail protein [Lentzea fradiae]SDF45491.1 phage tail protein domain-containing protein [Lentzea fradiae]
MTPPGADLLPTPYPLIGFLPAVFAESDFTVRWTTGFDDVLAPLISTIDCVDAYLDPMLAPEEFVRWLSSWFGVLLDESWPLTAQRAVVAEAVDLFRMRGTMAGLRRHLSVVVDGEVEIHESGGTSWSVRPRPEPPTDVEHWVRVVVRPRDPRVLSEEAVAAVIRAAKPVHVAHTLEVIS